ncbi:hypothetical protein ACJX0J_005942, partial [Zea mays]
DNIIAEVEKIWSMTVDDLRVSFRTLVAAKNNYSPIENVSNIYEGSWKNLIIFISLTLREVASTSHWHDRLFEALWAYRVSSYPLKFQELDALEEGHLQALMTSLLNTEYSEKPKWEGPFIIEQFFYGLISSFVGATLQIHRKCDAKHTLYPQSRSDILVIFTPLCKVHGNNLRMKKCTTLPKPKSIVALDNIIVRTFIIKKAATNDGDLLD